MPRNVSEILDRLEAVAAYDGSWSALRKEIPLLRERLRELREREERLDDVLIIALVGGSGVGKSTLLNALAGDELAKTSEYRPCTSVPTVYHPPGLKLDFESWTCVSGSALENLVIIDTPDSDTVVHEHRERVLDVLLQCDVIVICADGEKYLDEATWSLLRPLQDERSVVCVETKSTDRGSVEEHWVGRLEEQGFKVGEYFRVNALRTLDRKLSGKERGEGEFEFDKFEAYLEDELTGERIRGIKRSNVAGLLLKTVRRLQDEVGSQWDSLTELEAELKACDHKLVEESFEVVSRRLFAEPYLWLFALGRETSLRAKGIVGTLYRLLELVRTLPARFSGWSLLGFKGGSGQRAASLLTDKDLVGESDIVAGDQLKGVYLNAQSDVALQLARAGFGTPDKEEGYSRFIEEVNGRIADVLRGPARDSVVSKARAMTSWAVTIVCDGPVLGFVGFSAYNVVTSYFQAVMLSAPFFIHASSVLTIIVVTELFVLSLTSRFLAWSARHTALRALRAALENNVVAFRIEEEHILNAKKIAQEVVALEEAIKGS